jgi:nicotinamidase-related amidase
MGEMDMNKALLVTDMLNDFVRKGAPLEVPAARKIIPKINERIQATRDADGCVIFIADHHAEDDLEFDRWPPHAVSGTEGCEVIVELDRRPEDILVPKTRYSAFFESTLDEILQREDVDEVEVTGVCTSICVMFTVADLRNRYIPTTVYRDAVADLDDASHQFALKHMDKVLGAKVI